MSLPTNTGEKVYTLLVEYSNLTGKPTGRTKPNIPTDPNYIAPLEDLTMCPVDGTTTVPMTVMVSEEGNFTDYIISLMYGQATIDTTQVGAWEVPNRTYDAVIFQIPVPPANDYTLTIEYGSGLVKNVKAVNGGNIYVPGPFADITAIKMYAVAGDFNTDFNSDFY